MGTTKLVLKNTIAMGVNKISMPLFTFLLIIYIAKFRNVELLGQYSLVTVYYMILQILPFLGLAPLVVREMSKRPEERDLYLSNLSLLVIISSVVLMLPLWLMIAYFDYPYEVNLSIFVVCLSVLPNSLAYVCESAFIAAEKMEYIAVIIFMENLIRVLISIYLLHEGYGLKDLFIVLLFSKIAVFSVYFCLLNRVLGRFRFIFNREKMSDLLGHASIFFPSTILFLIFSRGDQILLSKLTSFKSLGYYTAAYRIIEAVSLLSSSIIVASAPTISRFYHKSLQSFIELCRIEMKYIILILCPAMVYLFFFSDWMIGILYSSAYQASIPVLKILAFSVLFSIMDQFFSIILISSDNQKNDLKASIAGSATYLVLLYILIYKWDIVGSAVATLTALVFQSVVRYIFIFKNISGMKIITVLFKPVFCAAVMFLSFYCLYGYGYPVAIAASAVVYVSMLFILRIISFKEFSALYAK